MSTYRCPECGSRLITIEVSQYVDVAFDDNYKHTVEDSPRGDLYWDNGSFANCAAYNCGYGGKLETFDTDFATKVRVAATNKLTTESGS